MHFMLGGPEGTNADRVPSDNISSHMYELSVRFYLPIGSEGDSQSRESLFLHLAGLQDDVVERAAIRIFFVDPKMNKYAL